MRRKSLIPKPGCDGLLTNAVCLQEKQSENKPKIASLHNLMEINTTAEYNNVNRIAGPSGSHAPPGRNPVLAWKRKARTSCSNKATNRREMREKPIKKEQCN